MIKMNSNEMSIMKQLAALSQKNGKIAILATEHIYKSSIDDGFFLYCY